MFNDRAVSRAQFQVTQETCPYLKFNLWGQLAASYTPGEMSVPVTWTKGDEAKNPTENQKVDFVASLLSNAIDSHDDLLEEILFSTSTNGILGLQNILPSNGFGSPGGIDAGVEAWWRNWSSFYATNGSDIEAQLEEAFNVTSKGSGGSQPTLIVSGADAQAVYTGQQVSNIRYVDAREADAGFMKVFFKTAPWIFSQYGGTRIYGRLDCPGASLV